jgi:hypothetical protein
VLFAFTPPTLAAATITYFGLCFFKKLKTFFWSSKFNDFLFAMIILLYPLAFSFLKIAEPTCPLCPAKISLIFNIHISLVHKSSFLLLRFLYFF